MIERIVVKGLDVIAYYESGKIVFYRKPHDMKYFDGCRPISKTVIKFMREHPNKVF